MFLRLLGLIIFELHKLCSACCCQMVACRRTFTRFLLLRGCFLNAREFDAVIYWLLFTGDFNGIVLRLLFTAQSGPTGL